MYHLKTSHLLVSVVTFLFLQGCGNDIGNNPPLNHSENIDSSVITEEENTQEMRIDREIKSDEANVVITQIPITLELTAKITESDVLLEWNRQKNIDHYILTIKESDEHSNSITLDKKENSYPDYSLETGIDYTYNLEALNTNNRVLARAEVNVTINSFSTIKSDEADI